MTPLIHMRPGHSASPQPTPSRLAGPGSPRPTVALVASCETDVINGRESCVRVGACTRSQRGRRDSLCPESGVAGRRRRS